MKRSQPLRRTAFKPKQRSRVTKSRTILYGEQYSALRALKAANANFRCEHCGIHAPCVMGADQPFWAGQLAHKGRGWRRSSTVEDTLWLCARCHLHYDGRDVKPCPPKAPKLEGK